jgi:hypothetical protein
MVKQTARSAVVAPTESKPHGSTESRREISIEDFLRSAHIAGVIDEASYQRLVFHYVGLTRPKPPAPTAPVKTRPPVPARVKPAPIRRDRPAAAVRRRTPAPKPPAPLPRPPQVPGPLQSAAVAVREAMAEAWKHLSADFAANTLTYIGVLLAVVVIFVFFAFGYIGDIVANPNLRPLVELGVPLFFLGLAWVLRNRTGLPAAASAVGLIGAVTLPVMLSASFQDGSLCCPPDVNGPPRWAMYGLVGILTAAIYLWLSTRARIYSYLVLPMLWTAAGAFGLYWTSGMSGPQIFTVLGAIAISILLAGFVRRTSVGRHLSIPTVRAGVLAAPFVLIVGLVFAYNDAIESGVAAPRLGDLAYPGIIAAVLTAAVFAVSSGTAYAWEGIPVRTRTAVLAVLRSLAYVTLAGAWLLTAGLGVPTGWLGVGLMGYAIAVVVVDRLVGGTDTAAVWIGRVTGAAGLVLALADPVPATLAWAGVATGAALRAVSPTARRTTSEFVPIPSTAGWWLAQLWTPALVTVAIVAGRVVSLDLAPWTLAVAAVGAAGARFAPRTLRQLRSYATVPTLLVIAAGAIATPLIWSTDARTGAMFLILAGAAALAMLAWQARLPVVAGLATVGVGWLIGGPAEPGPWGAAMIATATVATAGTVLIGASLVPRWREVAYAHGLLGHLYLYGALIMGVRFEEAAILALTAIIVTHASEALLVDRGDAPFVTELAAMAGAGERWVLTAPGAIAAIAFIPWTVLASLQVPWVAADVARLAPVLAALSWVYVAAAALRPRRFGPLLFMLSYALVGGALAVAIPSQPALTLATASGAGATMLLAIMLRAPYASFLSWTLGGAAFLLGASEAGVDAGDLHFWWMGLSVLVLAVAATANLVGGGCPGVRSRWLHPPMALALVSTVALIAVATIDGRWVPVQAVLAAAALVWLGWCTRIGGVSVLVAGSVGVAYLDVVAGRVALLDEPVYLMPYAFALLAVTVPMPGKRAWRFLTDPYPGTLLAGLTTVVLAMVLAVGTGDLAPVLGWSAVWFAAVFVLRREDPWLSAALVSLVAAGWTAGFGWAAAAGATAAVATALLSDARRDRSAGPPLLWVTAALVGATYGAFVQWQSWPASSFVVISIVLGGALSGTGLLMWLMPDLETRWRRWAGPAIFLGQGALFAASVVAGVAFEWPAASGAFGGVLLIEALLVGSLATSRLSRDLAWAASVIAAAAYGFGLRALEPTPRTTILVLAATAAIAGAAGVWSTLRPPRLDPVRLWIESVNAWAAFAAIATILVSYATLPAHTASLIAAGISFGAAVLLAVHTQNEQSAPWLRELSAATLLGSVAFLVAAIDPESELFAATLIIVAAMGVATAILGTGVQGAWRRPTLLIAAGLETVALIAAVVLIGPVSEPTGYVLALTAGALAGYGIVARDLRTVEAAIVTWALSALILINSRITLEIHSIVLTISVAMLAALDIERRRLRAEGREAASGIRVLEWVFMLAPLTLAANEALGDLTYAALLATEGAALLIWGMINRTRRRAFAGIGGIVTAIALAIVIPVIEGVRRGLAGETWLIVGAIAAVVLIAAGSVIEQRRERIGRRLAHVVEIVEDWH